MRNWSGWSSLCLQRSTSANGSDYDYRSIDEEGKGNDSDVIDDKLSIKIRILW
jgi:hypothetical protein